MRLFLIVLLCVSYVVNSQNTSFEKRSYTTARILPENSPTIDAQLNEAAWDAVQWTSDYVEWEPDNGSAPSQQTKMKIIYDAKNLYVAFYCYESDLSKIERRMGRRDDFPGDWVEINLDSFNDDRTAFSFTASVSGVKGDEFVSNNGNFDDSWNPIWYLKTQVVEDGWIAEMRIPLSQLRFGNAEEQIWGIQSTRRYFANEERSTWQPIPANPPGWVSEFGELRGLIGLTPQKQLEIQPYLVTQLDTYEKEPGNPFREGIDTKVVPGLDAKVGITNDLTLDLTINPDFGQVDADPGAVALDGFEIFFQERRPFFVENKNIFDFGFGGADNLFFSRRIGRSPQGNAFGPATAFAEEPINTTILGAAKFSGKTKDGWTLGVLESVTARELAAGINEDGSETETVVEPLTNYVVTRVQKDFNDRNSFLGGIFTAVHRNMEPNLSFLHTQAYSGGLDFQHNWAERTFYIEGNGVFSHVRGSKEAITQTQQSITHLFQRLDATHLEVDENRTSLTGTGGRFEIGKNGEGNWQYNLGGNFKSPELELNDTGFLRVADDIRQYANITRLFNKPTSWYRRANIRLSQSSSYDFQGNTNRLQYDIRATANFQNNWNINIGGIHKPRIFINSFLRGGPRWRYNTENIWFAFVNTDSRKKLSVFGGHVNSQATQNNFAFREYEIGCNYQPINTLSMSLNVTYSENPDQTQYVTETDFNGTPRYLVGAIDNNTLSTTLRVNYNINPNLTIQYYGQPFIFRASYSDFKYVNNSTAANLNDRVTSLNDLQISKEGGVYAVDENIDGVVDYSFGDPDFAFVQFRSNLVARWEYIPGSEIFLVWSQGITSIGDPNNEFGSIIDAQLLKQRPQNTFLIKATYRFVL